MHVWKQEGVERWPGYAVPGRGEGSLVVWLGVEGFGRKGGSPKVNLQGHKDPWRAGEAGLRDRVCLLLCCSLLTPVGVEGRTGSWMRQGNAKQVRKRAEAEEGTRNTTLYRWGRQRRAAWSDAGTMLTAAPAGLVRHLGTP